MTPAAAAARGALRGAGTSGSGGPWRTCSVSACYPAEPGSGTACAGVSGKMRRVFLHLLQGPKLEIPEYQSHCKSQVQQVLLSPKQPRFPLQRRKQGGVF